MMVLYCGDDQEAFYALYRKFSPVIYGYLRKKLAASEVDDAFQNFWRHLHEHRRSYKNQPVGPWLFVIVKNLVVDQYRSSGRRSKLLGELNSVAANSSDNKQIDIDSILHHLPDQSQTLVRKYYLEGFSFSDLEKETGLSQMSLRKRLSRVMSELRKKFEVGDEY